MNRRFHGWPLLLFVSLMLARSGEAIADESVSAGGQGERFAEPSARAAAGEAGAPDTLLPPPPSTDCCDGPDGCDACDAQFPPGPPAGCCAWLHATPKLTGDWGGARTALGESGIGFEADVTQFYMGNTRGGVRREFRYGGHGAYVLNADLGKLGVHEGLFLKLRAEHRFGQPLSGTTGALLPPNISANLPVPDSEDVYLTNVLFTQMLSPRFGVMAGKLDTFDGDANAFASGRGKTQFSNVGFVVNPALFRVVPYATLGAGFVYLTDSEKPQPLFTFMVLNATDTSRTSGFDELFEEGAVLTSELRVPTNFFGLPGHQLIGGAWSSREVASLGQDPRIVLPNVPIARQSGSWAVYWNFDQYVYVDQCDPTRGWGPFGRAAVSDDETNPIAWFLSFGIGGNSLLPRRGADTFGIGWYYSKTSDEIGDGPLRQALLGPIGDGQGVELYYNIAVTPSIQITPDVQVIVPARERVDTAVVAGIRARVDF